MVDWQHSLEQKWHMLRLGEVTIETRDDQHFFEVKVGLNDLDPEAVRVELYADGIAGSAPIRQEMKRDRQPAGTSLGDYVYSAAVSAVRSPMDFTARLIQHRDGVSVPLEARLILWQR